MLASLFISLSGLFHLVGCEPSKYVVGQQNTETTPNEQDTETDINESDSYPKDTEPLQELPTGYEQLAIVCARSPQSQDRIQLAFCDGATPKSTLPTIISLTALRTVINLGTDNPVVKRAVTGHSSALVARYTSAINPRVILFDQHVTQTPDWVMLGFVRGEQFVELIARDPQTGILRFFLFSFYQQCNDSSEGCSHADLLTSAIETDWTSYDLYEDDDLSNTIMDCQQCHQPNGVDTPKILRMQELDIPWTHWFDLSTDGGIALQNDFLTIHPVQGYATIQSIYASDPAALEQFVKAAGFNEQPNVFDSLTIEQEVQDSSPQQPEVNDPPGTSSTWETLYNSYLLGLDIPPPYHDVKVTDSNKLSEMITAYQAYQNGDIAEADFPDIRNVFLDDKMWAMGFTMKPNSTDQELLNQACAQCHNSRLNQDLDKAKFNVNLGLMDQEAKEEAIERLQLPDDHLNKMPPRRFKSLTADETERLISLFEE